MTVGFACFALVNGGGLWDVARQRVEACDALAHRACVTSYVLPTAVAIQRPLPIMLNPPSAASVIAVHVLIDVLTIVAMWYLVLRANQVERRSPDAILSKNPPLSPVSQI